MKKIGMVAICIAAVTLSAVAQEARRSRGNRSRGRSRSTGILDPLSSQQLPRNDHEDQLPADQTDLAVRWREAKSSNAKSKIAKVLTTRLDQIFDKDMAQRQRQIDAIEQRLARLKELYKKREQAKSKIVKLQAQAITMDWEGLGFARSNSRADGSILDNKPTPLDNGLSDNRFEVPYDEALGADLPPDDTAELDYLPQDNDDPLHEDDLLEEDGTPDDEEELPILDGGLGDGEFDELAPSDESDVDILDGGLGQQPRIDENDPLPSRSKETLVTVSKRYNERYGKRVRTFVKSCSDDPSVRRQLSDVLSVLVLGYFEFPGHTFREVARQGSNHLISLQNRGHNISPKYFERLAQITEDKASHTDTKSRVEYLQLIARLKHAAGDTKGAIKLQEAAVRHKPDNEAYRAFLTQLQQSDDQPNDTSTVPLQDDV